MKAIRLFVLVLVLSLLVVLAGAAGAQGPELLSSTGCPPGNDYDSLCDVTHDGEINVLDVQRVASRFRSQGIYNEAYWGLAGNAGTTPGTHFLGTTDGQDLIIKTNGQEAMRITTEGELRLKGPQGSASNLQIDLTGGYSIWRDDAGAGGDKTRLWFGTPDQGEVVIGPRAGAEFLGNLRLRSTSMSFESTSGNPTMHIAGGKVSIGTTSLSTKLHVAGKITGVYGGGVVQGGNPYTNRFLVGTLPKYALNADRYEKLFVTVWGGTWHKNTLGQDFYSISARDGLKVTRTRLFGATSNYELKIYDNGSNYDVVIEVVSKVHPNLVIRSQRLDSKGGLSEQVITNNYAPPGSPEDITIENHIIVDSAGKVGIGNINPQTKLDVNGTSRTKVLQITGGSDLAEPFEIIGRDNVEPGMVVAIDPEHPGQLRIADRAYDRTVAGCVSGANGLKPGLVMQQEGSAADGAFPVALSGRVYCWADASYGPIQPGDLLTTSDRAGHVMAVTDYQKAHGAIIGKAMSALEEGQGLVLVLVSLQ